MRFAACSGEILGARKPVVSMDFSNAPPVNAVTAPPGTGTPGQNTVSPCTKARIALSEVPARGLAKAGKSAASSSERLPVVTGVGTASRARFVS